MVIITRNVGTRRNLAADEGTDDPELESTPVAPDLPQNQLRALFIK
jgi:hypothetical protein